MKKHSLFQRALALLLAILLALPANPGNYIITASAAEEDEPVVQALDVPITINAEWQESEFKNGTVFDLIEPDNATNAVKLKVSYSSQKIREEGYKAGELIITVKGIGGVNRSNVVEALVGADKDSAAAKTRDWSYTWNKATDTYTLTNNNPIAGNSVFSGYFELVWNLKARDTVHNYTQDNIKAILYIPDEDAITSNTLTFSNKTKCDDFSIDIDRGMLYSAFGIDGGLSTKDYVFIKYTLTSHVDQNSRGLISGNESYYFVTDQNKIGAGGIITHATFDYKEDSKGNYNVTLKTNTAAGTQYAIVAYDRDTYVNKEISAYIDHYGAFHEGDDNGVAEKVFLCEDTISFVIPPNFDFDDDTGDVHEGKDSYYERKTHTDKKYAEQVAKRGGHISGRKMVNGTEETFYLGFSVQLPVSSGNTVSVDLIDDFMYITQNNGDYRQLQTGDYEHESVVIASTKDILNENYVPIRSGRYPVKIYAAQNGKVLDMSKYPVRPEEPVMDLTAELTVTEANETVYANCYAPIRQMPSADAEQIGYLSTGNTITRIGTVDNLGWSQVQTEGGETGYIFSKYLQLEEVSKPAELVWEGLWMDYEQEIDMPAGTTSVAIRYENLEESVWYDYDSNYVKEPACAINVKFHLNEEGFEEYKQANLIDGQVVNTMFINLYNSKGVLVNTDNYEDDYLDDDINLDLAQKDIDTYGRYLDRDKGSITFYGGDKSDYSSVTDIASIEGAGTKFNTTLTIGANFDFAETEEPNKFSLYTILAEGLSLNGYKAKEDLWTIMTLSGMDMTDTQLANACTPEVIENYKDSGRTYIALHFDFGDATVPQKSKILATFPLRVSEEVAKRSGTLPARSAVVFDRNIDEYTIGKVADNGNWADKTGIWSDIDRDENVDETLARSYDHTAYTYADSSHFEISKFVKTSYSEGWVQLPDVPAEEYGGTYQYKIVIRNGNSTASDIIVKDILETGANMQWQGVLQSVDLSQAEKLGMTGTVYYSSVETPSEELTSADWGTLLTEGTKAVAVDFGDSVLEASEELAVIFVMKAPSDAAMRDKITENGGMVSLSMADASTGNETKHDSLMTNFVQVKLTPPLRSIIVRKADAVSGIALKDANLELYDKETGKKVGETTTNVKGYAAFHDLPADNRVYVLKETQAPYGYDLMADSEVVLDYEDVRVTVNDPRKTGTIEVYKVNNLDTEMPVAGATYAIYDVTNLDLFNSYTHGNQVEDFLTEEQWAALVGKLVGTAMTDENGSAVFEDLPWGKYLITEKATPDGYTLNKTLYFLLVDRENVEAPIFLSTENVQKDVSIQLNKFASTVKGEETEIVLPGATFELIRVLGSRELRVGLYVTDENGQIFLSELPYGKYMFREYRAPVGYSLTANTEFELAPQNPDINLDIYDQRKPGSLIVTKKDDLGNMVEDIEFTLYAENKKDVVMTARTDKFGVVEFKDLEWGTYYLKETDAPDYYVENNELKQIEINKDSLEWVIEWINETVKGSVTLTKTNEDGNVALPGAVYTLYQDNGKVIGNYMTDENGQLTVENLSWGSYYFQETIAPVGYSLSEEAIRFSVNYTNAVVKQEIAVTDPLDAKSISLTKQIRADDINFANGMPTFVFKVEGTDFYGVKHEYYKSLVFNETYVKANTDEDGYVSQTIVLSELIAGEYLVTEQDSSRYQLVQIKNVVNGYTGGGNQDGVIFDLVNSNDGSAMFVNEKYENQDFSDTQTLTNIVKTYKKLTGVKATYSTNEVEAQSTVDPGKLTVTAIYDDGSTKILDQSEYTLDLDEYLTQSGEMEQRFPNKNGDYTVTVTHTDAETNITKSGRFDVTITGQEPVIVRISSTQGYVLKGGTIDPKIFTVTATYNDGTTGVLSSDQYTVSPDTAPNYEGDIEVTISLNLDVVKNEGRPVSTEAIVIVQSMPVLMAGPSFNEVYSDYSSAVVFTDIVAPEGATLTDVSAAQDGSIVAWSDNRTLYVSSQKYGISMAANANSRRMFYNWEYVYNFDLSLLDTSLVTDMSGMFENCESLHQLDLSNFNTSSVTTMSDMFDYCYSLQKLDISSFDTSNVTNMHEMFVYCKNLTELDVSSFDTTKATRMDYMFNDCDLLKELDLTNFNTSSVFHMAGMFAGCNELTTIFASAAWSTEKVIYSQYMFNGCSALVGNVGTTYDSSYTTAARAKLDGGPEDPGYFSSKFLLSYDMVPIGKRKTPNVFSLYNNLNYSVVGYEVLSGEEFVKLDALTGEVTGIAKGQAYIKVAVKDENGNTYFAGTKIYVGPFVQVVYSADDNSLTFYQTEDVITVGDSYKGKTVTKLYRFTEDDTSQFTSYSSIPWYSLRNSVKSVIFADEVKPLSTAYWFYQFSACTSMDLANLNTSAVTNMSYMFYDCSQLTSLDLSRFNTSAVTNMSYMFSFCSQQTSLDLSGFDTAAVTNMSNMFSYCRQLTSLDLSSFNTAAVTNMSNMFRSCSQLTSLDLSSFNTAAVTNMNYMFCDCTNLSTIYASDAWSTQNVTSSGNMFFSCSRLVGGIGTKYNTSNQTHAYAKIDGGTSDPGYFTSPLGIYYSVVPLGEKKLPDVSWIFNDLSYEITGYEVVSGKDFIDYDETTGVVTGVADGIAVIKVFSKDENDRTYTTIVKIYIGAVVQVVYSDDDGSLTFYKTDETITVGDSYKGKTVTKLYQFTEDETSVFYHPWGKLSQLVKSVSFADEIKPLSTSYWFSGFEACASMDLSKLNTSAVTNMSYMFYNCSQLTSLNLFSFNTSAVTNMSYMFYNCSNLTTIYASDIWSVAKVTSSDYMFTNCSLLIGGAGTKFSSSYTNILRAHIDGGASDPGYFSRPLSLRYDIVPLGETKLPVIMWAFDNIKYTAVYEIVSGADNILLDTSTGAVTGIADGRVTIKISVEDETGRTFTLTADVFVGSFVQVIYSADDNSLTFYKTDETITVGDSYKGKTVTALYQFTEEETGEFTAEYKLPWYNERNVVKSVSFVDEITPISTQFWFFDFKACTSMDLKKLNTAAVTNMDYMFYNCSKLTSLDLSSFNTSAVTNMSNMFYGCSQLTALDLSSFNTFAVTNMGYMFYNCSQMTSLDLSSFNTAAVTDMGGMFSFCSKLIVLNLSSFNTSSVISTGSMFQNCSKLTTLDLTSFNTSNVTNMYNMFYGCSALTTIYASDAWSTVKVTMSYNMFSDCTLLVGGAGTKFNSNSVTASRAKLDGGTSNPGYFTSPLNLQYNIVPIGETILPEVLWAFDEIFDEIKYSARYEIVSGEEQISLDTTTGSVTGKSNGTAVVKVTFEDEYGRTYTATAEMIVGPIVQVVFSESDNSLIFYNTSDTIKVGDSYKGKLVTNLYQFTEDETSAFNLPENIPWTELSQVVKSVTFADEVKPLATAFWFFGFTECTYMDLRKLNTSDVTNMSGMFCACIQLSELDLSGFNTSKVTDMSGMFCDCNQLGKLDISRFDTSAVSNMTNMFAGCDQLSSLDVSNFDTSAVTDMSYMFCDCNQLSRLDLTGFDISSVMNMDYMFAGCGNLETIFATESWSIQETTTSNDMFAECLNLTGGNGTTYNSSSVTASYAKIDNGASDRGYFTYPLDLQYNIVPIDEAMLPMILWAFDDIKYTAQYEIISGEENISLDTTTGAVSGLADGKATIKVSLEDEKGRTFTAMADFFVGPCVQVVYSADDNSLAFYKTDETITVGDSYKGKTVTNLYQFTEAETSEFNSTSSVPWYTLNASVKSVVFADEIKPLSTSYWFYDFFVCTNMDLTKLNTSDVTNMSYMFNGCYQLTSLDLSSFNTAAVTNMSSMFSGCSQLTALDLSSFDTAAVTNMSYMFNGCSQLTSLDLSSFNTAAVTNMSYMFNGCSQLTSLDLSSFNTAAVTNMSYMFSDCNQLTEIDLMSFDTSLVTTMNCMFSYCYKLTTIFVSNMWSVENVSSSDFMFANSRFLVGGAGTTYNDDCVMGNYARIDGGRFAPGYLTGPLTLHYDVVPLGETQMPTLSFVYENTSYEINGYEVISGQEIISLNTTTGAVTGLADGKATIKVSLEDEKGRTFTAMADFFVGPCVQVVYSADDNSLAFYKTDETITVGDSYKGKTVTNLYQFTEAETSEFNSTSSVPWYTLNASVKSVVFADEIKPLSTSYWFYDFFVCTNMDLTKLNTSDVTNMSYMFNGCYQLTSLDLSSFNTAAVTNMSSMFSGCSQLTALDLSSFNTVAVTDMSYMFSSCRQLTFLDLSSFNTAAVTNMSYMFNGCSQLTSLDLSSFNTAAVTNMSYMFNYCNQLKSLDLSSFNTAAVTNMSCMFSGCSQLTALDLSSFNTVAVTDMSYMFSSCSQLTSLDLSSFDTAAVTNMSYMFNYCNQLKSLDLSSFDTAAVINMESMFMNCSQLTSLDLSSFDTAAVTNMSCMFYYCTNLTTIYAFDAWSTGKVTSSTNMFYECTKLVGGAGTTFNNNYRTVTRAKIDGGTSKPGYFTYCFSLNYDTVYVGETVYPKVMLPAGFVATNFEVVSGNQIITIDATTGAVAGEARGEAVVKITATTAKGKTISKQTKLVVLQPIDLIIDNKCADVATVGTNDAVVYAGVTEFTLTSVDSNKIIISFDLNGVTISGNAFMAPEESSTVTITNVVAVVPIIIESEHNPYPNSMNTTTNGIQGKVYGDVSFAGATSLTIRLDYQTESTSYDWIYLYDANGSIVNNKKYGGSTRKQETITVAGNYVKIVFCTDSSVNSYYGFHATITPNFD